MQPTMGINMSTSLGEGAIIAPRTVPIKQKTQTWGICPKCCLSASNNARPAKILTKPFTKGRKSIYKNAAREQQKPVVATIIFKTLNRIEVFKISSKRNNVRVIPDAGDVVIVGADIIAKLSAETSESRPVAAWDQRIVIQRSVNIYSSDSSCSCLLYTSPSPRDKRQSRMPSSA